MTSTPRSTGDLSVEVRSMIERTAPTVIDLDAPETIHPLAGATIDLVALNYWPEQHGIAPYATQMAEHLAEIGTDITAVVGMPHYPAWKIEPRYARKLRSHERQNGVTLRRLRHFVPARQSALRRATYEATFLAQAATQRTAKADLVVTMIPSLGGGIAAAMRAKRLGAPLVIVVQDLVGAAASQSGIKGGARVARMTGKAEGWLLRKADVVAVLNEAFRTTAIGMGVRPDDCVVLPNWSHAPEPQTPRAEMRERLGWPEGTAVVLHSGNMGLKQDLGNVVEAARLAEQRGDDVLFVLMGDGSTRAELEAQGAGISTLRIIDGLPDKQDFVDALAAADALLINEKPSVVDMSLPSKLTSYFCATRPVIAASVSEGTTAAQVRASEGGLVIEPGNPALLLDTALALHQDPVTTRRLGRAGRSFALRELDKGVALGRFDAVFMALLGRDAAPLAPLGDADRAEARVS